MLGVLFVYCMLSCVLVDIVPVSSEQLVEVEQEQVFEEQEPPMFKQGRQVDFSPCIFYFLSHTTCMITKFIFKCCIA
jgi:hypothetical protein